jgi:hypothetical protein
MNVLLIALEMACTWAQSPAPESPPNLERRVRDYVAQWRVEGTRTRAFDRLAHLPVEALPILERQGADPELLDRIKAEVTLNQKLKQSYGPPHTFRFEGREESVGDVLLKLEAATGVTFYKHSIDLGTLTTLGGEDLSFWEVLDELGRKASLVAYSIAGDQIYLNPGVPPEKPRSFYGPLMLSIDRLTLDRRTDFESPTHTLSIQLTSVWERHVFPMGLTGRYVLFRVVDDQGASLIPTEKKAAEPPKTPPGGARVISQTIELGSLKPPSPKSKKLALVEGSVELEFPSRMDAVSFRQPGQTAAPPQVLEGVTVELRSCASSTSGGVLADFALEFSTPADATAYQPQPRDVEFIPTGGQKQALYIYNARTDGALVTFTARCYNLAQPSDLKEVNLRIPRGALTRNIPFSFKDVEIK